MYDCENPDIVLLDIKLPKKDGVDVLREIRKKNKDAKVIMETSVYEDKTSAECLNLGALDFLKKPISKKYLQDALAKA